jgi:UDP-N-acetylmuramoyl-tripeptide--D-alanyl-D-alanine ligase
MLNLQTIINVLLGNANSIQSANKIVTGFSIDTRTLTEGNVFIALQGEVAHGNAFINQAVEKGAIAVITDRPITSTISTIVVEDSLKALIAVAEYQRAQFKGKVCGITGTVGKTSVKEAMGFLTKAIGYNTHISEKSYNNHIGVPLTLANLNPDADIAVIEMGMNHPREILPLSQLARPHITIITNIGPGHIAAFTDIKEIALEKLSIVGGLMDGGVAVLPKDSEFFDLMKDTTQHYYNRDIVSFGHSSGADIQVLSVDTQLNRLHITARVMDTVIEYDLPTLNYAWVNNSLAIIAALYHMNIDPQKSADQFKNFSLIEGRGCLYSLTFKDKNIRLIDDAYNANPLSMKAALETLSKYSGRKVAVIGDMRELGEFSEHYHKEIGNLCKTLKLDLVLTYGNYMKKAFDELSPSQQLVHVEKTDEILPILSEILEDNDTILFKASNGTKLYQVVGTIVAASKELI